MSVREWIINILKFAGIYDVKSDGTKGPNPQNILIYSGLILNVWGFVWSFLSYITKKVATNIWPFSTALLAIILGSVLILMGFSKKTLDGQGIKPRIPLLAAIGLIIIVVGASGIIFLLIDPPSTGDIEDPITPVPTTITPPTTLPPTTNAILTPDSNVHITEAYYDVAYQYPWYAPLSKNYWDISDQGSITMSPGETFTYNITFHSDADRVDHGIDSITLGTDGFSLLNIQPPLSPITRVHPGSSITETLTIHAPDKEYDGQLTIRVHSLYLD